MAAPVLVIGSFVQDLTYYVERFRAPGETLMGKFVTGPGGKGSNQAIASARTGVRTAFFGAVGDDAFGAEVVALGANEKFTAADVEFGLLEAAQVVVLQREIHPETTSDLLAAARKRGRTTIFNPAPMDAMMDFTTLENVDIFIPNETEFVTVLQNHPELRQTDFSLEKLTALEPGELHTLCRDLHVPLVIVTMGSRGCFISKTEEYEFISACAGIQAIDSTGAGDAFVGGFASGLVQFGGDISKAARYGIIVAGLSVTKLGAANSMPRKKEIVASGLWPELFES